MSTRGRGFNSRGGGSSYRGRGGGSDWNSGSGGSSNVNRGGYSSSRGGRFKYSTPSYDSRNKYNSSGGSDRYSSRGGRGDHSNNYKRPRDSYSSRDDHRSSSESNRKRVRNDSYQGEGNSSQRYSSSSYGGGSGNSTSYNDNKRSSSSAAGGGSYDDKRQSDRQSSYHRSDERHSSSSRNYAAPPPPRISDMAPPSQRYNNNTNRGRVSHQSTNYRGRLSARGRGSNFRSSRVDALLARKRNMNSNLDYRRKMITSRPRDYIQRVRMTTGKIRRSSGSTRISSSKKESSGTGSSTKDKDRDLAKVINAEFTDDEDEEKDAEDNWDDDEEDDDRDDNDDDEEKMPISKDNENEEEDEEKGENQEKKPKEEKRKKDKSDRQSVKDDNDDEEIIKDEDDDKIKQQVDEDDEEERERDDRNDDNEKDERKETDDISNRRENKRFIKLQCPHCSHRSSRFKEYSLHLFTGRHKTSMKRVAARYKATLARMRVLQRQEQGKLEAREASHGNLPSRTMFCQICKLNYRSLKAQHHRSDAHRRMKRLLTPFCRTCRVQFRTYMPYETHVASLDHIRRKQIMMDDRVNGNNDDDDDDDVRGDGDSSAQDEDDKEVDLNNFMTLDSVGDVDAEDAIDGNNGGSDNISEKKVREKSDGDLSTPDNERRHKTKQMIKVGSEYIKIIEVQYCELCKIHLPRNENAERAVAMHCSLRSHLKRYVRDNNDKELRRQAEKIHLQTSSSSSSSLINNNNPASTIVTTVTTANSISPVETDKVTSDNEASLTPANKNINDDDDEDDDDDDDAEEVIDTPQINNESQSNNELFNTTTDKLNDTTKTIDGEIEAEMWDEVVKLNDILPDADNEIERGKSSDDEESRYDRFRNSDKKKQAILLNKEKEKEKKNEQSDMETSPLKTDVKIKAERVDK